ncbi:MAG: hypothetical protein JWO60_2075 [Frankiales bacterium]|nr:hypothetical protein [Frankiales bacterium]
MTRPRDKPDVGERIPGLSMLARVVETCGRDLQRQEFLSLVRR